MQCLKFGPTFTYVCVLGICLSQVMSQGLSRYHCNFASFFMPRRLPSGGGPVQEAYYSTLSMGGGVSLARTDGLYRPTGIDRLNAGFLAITVTVTVTDSLLKHELQKSLHPSPVVSRYTL
jgi:hypothetical protein